MMIMRTKAELCALQGDAEIGDLEKSLTILETLISAAQRSVQKPKGRNENAASSSKATRSLARSQSKSGLLTQQLRGTTNLLSASKSYLRSPKLRPSYGQVVKYAGRMSR